MLEVVDVAVVRLSTLASLTALSFNVTLDLDIVPHPIAIYPPLPAPYSFDPVPIPIRYSIYPFHICSCSEFVPDYFKVNVKNYRLQHFYF